MKKMFLFALLSITVVFGLFAQNGIIREMSGEVELKPAGASGFAAAKQGDEVAQSTIVSTGFKSTAVIAVGSTLITVRPLTRLSLKEISAASGTENLNVNLQAGRVKVDVKPPAGTKANCKVQTLSATASVRGTTLEADDNNISVTTGKVIVAGSSGAGAIVNAGETSTVGNDGTAGTLGNIPNEGLGNWVLEVIEQANTNKSGILTVEIVYQQ